jgi:hypothetical protein
MKKLITVIVIVIVAIAGIVGSIGRSDKTIKYTVFDFHGNDFCPYLKIHTEPMTLAELEAFGDSLLKKYHPSATLKIQVYWNPDVAEICVKQNRLGQTQFYNSFHEKGKRAYYTAQSGEPKSFCDEDLYQFLYKNTLYFPYAWAKPVGFNAQKQVLHLKTTVKNMAWLAWETFQLLGDRYSGCLFDKLPNLKFVKIDYYDSNNIKIGEGYFDLKYWAKMISISDIYDKMAELDGPESVYGDPGRFEIAMWNELLPLAKEFYLTRQLPDS